MERSEARQSFPVLASPDVVSMAGFSSDSVHRILSYICFVGFSSSKQRFKHELAGCVL